MRCTVTATMQAPGNLPVQTRWATDATPVAAIMAVAQLLEHEDVGDSQPIHATITEITVSIR